MIFVLCLLGMMIGAYFFVNSPSTAQMSTMLSVSLSLGALMQCAQFLSLYATLNITWEEPWASIMSLFQVFAFDITLLRLDCVVQTNPISKLLPGATHHNAEWAA